ncbi:MAG: hypothetical protein PSX80_09920, partial [bacterium]|nr:hypothetical protein [bacterium]
IALTASAQPPTEGGEDDFDPDAAPPPVRAMNSSERTQLDNQQGLKERTKLALALMSSRLSKAEELNAKNEFPAMYNELGGFHALMDDTLAFLEAAPRKDKTLDNLKRFEMTLRGFAPRLALIRREAPQEYDHYVRVLLRYLRDARSKAIEPLFGDSVVPNRRTT